VSALSVTLAPAAMAAQEAMMVAEVLSLQIHHAPHVAWQNIDVTFASQLVLMLTVLLPIY
jgi:hypothetical protein